MSDGIVLTTTLWTLRSVKFNEKSSFPVNYQSFPYNYFVEKAIVLQWATALLLKTMPQHAILIQHMRGNGSNTGKFAGFHQAQDIADTVTWLKQQYWWNGVLFGTGKSAMGVMSYLSALVNVPMRAQSVSIAAADEYKLIYQNGAFRSALVNGMLKYVNQTDYNVTYIDHEDPGPWWNGTNLDGHYAGVKWPAVHTAGWYDVFQQDTLDVYHGYRTQSDPEIRDLQFLIIEPKGHCFAGGAVKWHNLALAELSTLASTFAGMLFGVLADAVNVPKFEAGLELLRSLSKQIPRVFWYVMGSGLHGAKGNWIAAADALPTPTPTPMYLAPHKTLSEVVPNQSSAFSYVYNPEDPVKTLGGNNMGAPPALTGMANLPCGPWDQLPVNKYRTDVLVFTSEKLQTELAITGRTKIVLFVSSNVTDTDFTAKLVDVFPNGTRLLLQDGIQRMRWRYPHKGPQFMSPGEVYKIEIDLWSTSYIFMPNHSIGVDISSSNVPQFDANPNTGYPLKVTSRVPYTLLANNTVHTGLDQASHVLLPVVPLDSVAPVRDKIMQNLLPHFSTTADGQPTLAAKLRALGEDVSQ
eukprot:CAMPEP_0174297250 /NCGR_PEP_ID=MMETSP0809-20121228/50469_1 /TAXON_ID=73025 ORGANISM="Eutreptiella gymnastica-like, Strain CCMP1594" /NCGR_SAMPLE_ID=MMETSP0809 /ASSEMBLY_ACC=CAM_ASM_000658 /LENGTH=578 /DNA_ID=CAMNT_0015400915 /DNA_START=137 /DNA_END=1873 /DNA_ORIENTATION=+